MPILFTLDRLARRAALLLATALLSVAPALGQAPLFMVDQETTVREISFRFMDHQTFETERLKEQISLQEPGFLDRVKRWVPFLEPAVYPFSPIELQRDVVRLRNFYNRNGFLSPDISYPASQLDTTSNTIHIIFRIEEGPPLVIQDFGFFGPDSTYAASIFEGPMRERWFDFRDRFNLRAGDRYTDAERLRIRDELLNWMKDQGYAFAQVSADAQIDSTYNTVDLRFYLDPGPVGYFSEINIEGSQSVERNVVLRELPFKEGDRFSNTALSSGQRELFNLNLFRVALAELPPQERDSTVTVQLRLREANPRYVSTGVGYGQQRGVQMEGQWTHRNFIGGARNLSVNLTAETGLGASEQTEGPTAARYHTSVTLRQPYLFSTRVSGIIGPFAQVARVPRLQTDDADAWTSLKMNTLRFGLETTVLYEIYSFRTVSLSHTISRAVLAGQTLPGEIPADPDTLAQEEVRELDPYSSSVVTLNATLGRVNDYLNPQRGFRIRPLVEVARDWMLPGARAGVEYYKTSLDAGVYVPLLRRVTLRGRLFGGRLWPQGASRQQFEAPYENRFDPIRFYAGGSSDVRGWGIQRLGPLKLTRTVSDTDTTLVPEEVGGLAKVAGSIEVLLPFPGLGSAWHTATFLDFGQVYTKDDADIGPLGPDETRPTLSDFFDPRLFKYGTGVGVRYETPIGFIRLDLGFKINPDPRDLLSLSQLYEYRHTGQSLDAFDTGFIRRFRIHLSIGQQF